MEKTKRKTGGIAKFIEEAKHYRDNPAVLNNIIEAMSEKIDELEAKAAAYDRVMSGEPTSKEIANILNRIIAMDHDGKWHACDWQDSLTLPDGWEEK